MILQLIYRFHYISTTIFKHLNKGSYIKINIHLVLCPYSNSDKGKFNILVMHVPNIMKYLAC